MDLYVDEGLLLESVIFLDYKGRGVDSLAGEGRARISLYGSHDGYASILRCRTFGDRRCYYRGEVGVNGKTP